MRKHAGTEEVTKNTSSTIRRIDGESSSFDTIMGLPEDLFDEEKVVASIPTSAATNESGISEDITEELALQLIGKNQMKPNCVYKLISTPHSTCVTQYDLSLDKSDPEYSTEYELEEYKEGYRPGIDEGSVSSGFWQGQDMPKRISPMTIVAVIMISLLLIGIGGIAFVLSL